MYALGVQPYGGVPPQLIGFNAGTGFNEGGRGNGPRNRRGRGRGSGNAMNLPDRGKGWA
jgi:hypothetical protein